MTHSLKLVYKLRLPHDLGSDLPRLVAENPITPLPITLQDTARTSILPFHHNGPFDRLIAAQCQNRNLPIMSREPAFEA